MCAGDVVFTVDLHQNDKTPFHGPCDMMLEEDCITVTRRQKLTTASHQQQQQQIQWSITHLKKFWVKSDVRQLILLVGRWALIVIRFFCFVMCECCEIFDTGARHLQTSHSEVVKLMLQGENLIWCFQESQIRLVLLTVSVGALYTYQVCINSISVFCAVDLTSTHVEKLLQIHMHTHIQYKSKM